MALWLNILLLVLALAILVATGAYDIKAAIALKKDVSYGTNTELHSAHTFLTWAAIISIIGAALILTLIGLYIFFGAETAAQTLNTVSLFLMIGTILLVAVSGILSAIASAKMGKSDGKEDAVRASVLSLVSVFALIVLQVLFWYFRTKCSKPAGTPALSSVLGALKAE